MSQVVLLERPSFWPEPRDPEAWLRALDALERALPSADCPSSASPRTVGERCLPGFSRRSVPGLFGAALTHASTRLHGVGLLEHTTAGWKMSDEGRALLECWRSGDVPATLQVLALQLLRRSIWLRLLLVRFDRDDWHLVEWSRLRRGDACLATGHGLDLGALEHPGVWTKGIEPACLGAWGETIGDTDLELRPHIVQTAKSSDGFSWAPLKGPLYLLDSLGWMDERGRLTLPPGIENQVVGHSYHAWLTEITATFSDFRGFAPVEPVMRSLAKRAGLKPSFELYPDAFAGWMDELLDAALRTGAIELHAAEPGQARHGRGLFGDRERKLVRWTIHPEFDALFMRQQNDLALNWEIRDNPGKLNTV